MRHTVGLCDRYQAKHQQDTIIQWLNYIRFISILLVENTPQDGVRIDPSYPTRNFFPLMEFIQLPVTVTGRAQVPSESIFQYCKKVFDANGFADISLPEVWVNAPLLYQVCFDSHFHLAQVGTICYFEFSTAPITTQCVR